jgi:hypothetical protein
MTDRYGDRENQNTERERLTDREKYTRERRGRECMERHICREKKAKTETDMVQWTTDEYQFLGAGFREWVFLLKRLTN